MEKSFRPTHTTLYITVFVNRPLGTRNLLKDHFTSYCKFHSRNQQPLHVTILKFPVKNAELDSGLGLAT